MLCRCHIQRSSGLHDGRVRQDDTSTRSLIVTRWISPNPAQPHRYEHTFWQFTQKCHPYRPSFGFQKFPHFPFSHAHTFSFYKTSCIVFKVLSALAAINVQTKSHSDINLGGQGMIITNQGVAIQQCFQQAKHMQFYKIGQ